MAQINMGVGGGASAGLVAPQGLEQIVATFGDIYEYIRTDGSLDPRWPADFLTKVELRFALQLSWDLATRVKQITCHRKMTDVFSEVFQELLSRGLQTKVETLGRCFSFRAQRTGSKLSTHAWGIAVDLNPATNAQGSEGDMSPDVVAVFRGAGFT